MAKDYSKATVLVTGHTGFKGAWLALWLRMLGARVVGFSLDKPSNPCLFDAIALQPELVHIQGDIRDQKALDAAFAEHKPDLVFHLAAQALVRLSYAKPVETFESNVIGTLRVLEAARACPSVLAIINVTSDKCYENQEWVYGYRESDPLGGHDPYSASKACAELAARAYARSFFSRDEGVGHAPGMASVRAGNVIGGGDWGAERLVPDCVAAFSRQEKVALRSPEAVRPWQHVLEPLAGYLMLGSRLAREAGKWSGPWNFGPDESEMLTVGQLVSRLAELWGSGQWEVQSQEQPHETACLKLNISKARTQLGWSPRFGFEQALAMTAKWYKKYYSGASPQELMRLSRAQIESYGDLL